MLLAPSVAMGVKPAQPIFWLVIVGLDHAPPAFKPIWTSVQLGAFGCGAFGSHEAIKSEPGSLAIGLPSPKALAVASR